MKIGDDGLLNAAEWHESPNQDDRPQGERIVLAVVHSISLPPGRFGGEDVIRLFTNRLDCSAHPYYEGLRGLRVSSHFLLRRDGQLLQFVSCNRRAWHAGESCWRGRPRCNDYSVGVELEGTDDLAYSDIQYTTLACLLRALAGRYPIENIVGHSDIAPGRKSDPGATFDWSRLRTLISST